MIQARKKKNSSKVNLTISLVFHTALILGIAFLAAREGLLGKQLKQLALIKVAPEKKPEPPKQEKPPEPKVEQAKTPEPAKTVALAPPPKIEAAAPPPVDAAPAVAPPPSISADFAFSDGAHAVTTGDANTVYKSLIEHALRSHWDRPEDLDDSSFVAEVELTVDGNGQAAGYQWLKGSGNSRWDNSVKEVLAKVKSFNRPPPKGFPGKFAVRFDVESMRTEDVIQVSSR